MEEIVKTSVIESFHTTKPRKNEIRMCLQQASKEVKLDFVTQLMALGIHNAVAGRVEGVTQTIDGVQIGYYFTEAERSELMESWGDDIPPLSDYQLIDHYQGYMLDKFFDEWFDYFKTYINEA